MFCKQNRFFFGGNQNVFFSSISSKRSLFNKIVEKMFSGKFVSILMIMTSFTYQKREEKSSSKIFWCRKDAWKNSHRFENDCEAWQNHTVLMTMQQMND